MTGKRQQQSFVSLSPDRLLAARSGRSSFATTSTSHATAVSENTYTGYSKKENHELHALRDCSFVHVPPRSVFVVKHPDTENDKRGRIEGALE